MHQYYACYVKLYQFFQKNIRVAGPCRGGAHTLHGCVRWSPIWRIRAWRLPGRWPDGGLRSTVARWTRRRAAPAYAPIPDVEIPATHSRSVMSRSGLRIDHFWHICLLVQNYVSRRLTAHIESGKMGGTIRHKLSVNRYISLSNAVITERIVIMDSFCIYTDGDELKRC